MPPDPPTPAEETPHPPRTAHPLHRIFFGDQGLRAGWGALLFLLLVALLSYALTWMIRPLAHARTQSMALPPGYLIAGELILAGSVLLVTLIMARLEHRRFTGYGYAGQGFAPRFGGGLLCGFAAISALVGFLCSRHLLVLHGPVLPASSALGYGLAWGLGFLLVGVFEESLLRGYLLFTLGRPLGFWWSALLLSILFGLIHGTNKGETLVGLFSAGAVGLFFCLTIWYTGSLWYAIGFHAAWDWGESFFWGTSDSGLTVKGHLFGERATGPLLLSGGLTGPEGSLYIFPLLLLCALLAFFWWRRKPRPTPAPANRRGSEPPSLLPDR